MVIFTAFVRLNSCNWILLILLLELLLSTNCEPAESYDDDGAYNVRPQPLTLAQRSKALFSTLGSQLNQSRRPMQVIPAIPVNRSAQDDYPPYPINDGGGSYQGGGGSGFNGWGNRGQRVVYIAIPLNALSALLSAGQLSTLGLGSIFPALPSIGGGIGGGGYSGSLDGSQYSGGGVGFAGGTGSLGSLLAGSGVVGGFSGGFGGGSTFGLGVGSTLGQFGNSVGGKYGSGSYGSSTGSSYSGSSSYNNNGDSDYGSGGASYDGDSGYGGSSSGSYSGSSNYGGGGGVVPLRPTFAPVPIGPQRPILPISGLGVGIGGLQTGSLACSRGVGFYRHPIDCNRFYRCVDSQAGPFKIYEFNCPAGTVYSVVVSVCVWPYQPEAGSCYSGNPSPIPFIPPSPLLPGLGGGGQFFGGSNSYGTYGDDDRADGGASGDNTISLPTTRRRRKPKPVVVTEEEGATSRPRCLGVGFFAHPFDCTQFAQCWKSSDGDVTGYYFKCPPKTIFNSRVPVCDDPANVPDASPSCTQKLDISIPQKASSYGSY